MYEYMCYFDGVVCVYVYECEACFLYLKDYFRLSMVSKLMNEYYTHVEEKDVKTKIRH